MRLALVGDTHGSMQWMCSDVIPYAAKQGCDVIVQIGDFGFVWHGADYPRNLDKLSRYLGRNYLRLVFLPGNHEDHDLLAELEVSSKRTGDGHYVIRSRIAYTGRASRWTWDGVSFAAVGGAVSIDRDWRLAYERRTGRRQWWPQERLTPDEFAAARAMEPVDVLLTHDAPSAFPDGGLKPDLESTANRQALTDVGRALRPKRWYHGHYHRRLDYDFHHDGGVCEVHCLDCDGSPRTKGVEVLDLAAVNLQASP